MTIRHYKLPNTLAIVALLYYLPAPAQAQPVKPSPTRSSILLFGFEGTNGAAGWRGLKCSLTNTPVSEGTQALTFVIPQDQKGDNKWPSAIIDYANGKGYACKDWSHYAFLALDAWTDSSKPEKLSIELRDGQVRNNLAHNRILQPGIKNEIKVSLTEIEKLDTSDVQQLIFFASLPPRSFRVTIDNVRLIPGEPPPVAEFDLIYPNYRNLIFPGAESLRVSAKLNLDGTGIFPRDLALRLDATAQRAMRTEAAFSELYATGSILAGKFAPGSIGLTAAVIRKSTGQPLASQTWALRKITPAEVSALKVYIDANNNTIVDGKPFFPLGWFNSPSEQYLDEIADSPFNCVLDYGMDHVQKETMLRYLDAARQKGIKVIYCLNDVYPGATYLQSWEGIHGNQPIADAVVRAYKDHPAVLAWYLNDELPKEMEPQLRDYYQRIAGADPNHPCYIVLCNMPEVKHFAKTTDIMGVDPYPVPSAPVTMVAKHTDAATQAVRDHKPAWIVPQAFAWYQYNSHNQDRAHPPSDAELKEGRAPTFEEARCMTYLALTHGAKGLIYYCYYDFRVLPQYHEMWSWMKSIASEVKTLSPMLLSPTDLGPVECIPPLAGIQTRLKKHQSKFYLLAVNGETNGCHAVFELGRKTAATAQVLFENRLVRIQGKQLADDFKPLEVHVYQW